MEIAAHKDHHGDYEHAESKSGTRHDIHGKLQRTRTAGHPGRRRSPF
jgi:hypothetical protein